MAESNKVRVEYIGEDKGLSNVSKEVAKSIGGVDEAVKKSSSSTKDHDKASGGLLDKLRLSVDPISLVSQGFYLLRDAAIASAQAYAEAEVVDAQLNAVLQSTGEIAGMTAEELDVLATSLSRMSGVDDEVIKRGEALLLTFTKIGSDVFPQATEAALNMSQAMGTDLQSSIIQVGKALNEPIEGVSALRRVGVQLTDAQEDQIKAFMKMNDVASAQKIILDELNTQFGGVAAMMGDTTTGSTNKLKNAWEDLLATMGEDSAGIWKITNEALTELVINMDENVQASHRHRDAMTEIIDLLDIQPSRIREVTTGNSELALSVQAMAAQLERGAEMTRFYNSQLSETAAATESFTNTTESIPIVMEAVKAGITGTITDAYDKYETTLTKLQGQHSELSADLAQLQAWGWQPSSEKVQDLTQKIMENEAAQRSATVTMQEAIDKMIFQQAAAGLDAAATLELARSMGMLDEQSYAVATATEALRQQYLDGQLTASEYAAKVAELRDRVNELQSKEITITVNQIGNYVQTEGHEQSIGGPLGGGYAQGTSGWMTVPPGYPNDSYTIGLTSGEDFAVIPAGESPRPGLTPFGGGGGAGGGNNITVVLQIQSPITLLDQQRGAEALLSYVEQGVKTLQERGVI